MNALPLSRLAQNQQEWLLHLGHGWSVLTSSRSEEKGYTLELVNPHTDDFFFLW